MGKVDFSVTDMIRAKALAMEVKGKFILYTNVTKWIFQFLYFCYNIKTFPVILVQLC